MNEARIDKWLWAARIFKTRSIAADACKNGRVTINGSNVKPSRMLKVGETVSVRKPPITYSFKVLKAIEMRVGAKLLPEIYENVTTPDQYELLEMSRISGFVDRARGAPVARCLYRPRRRRRMGRLGGGRRLSIMRITHPRSYIQSFQSLCICISSEHFF